MIRFLSLQKTNINHSKKRRSCSCSITLSLIGPISIILDIITYSRNGRVKKSQIFMWVKLTHRTQILLFVIEPSLKYKKLHKKHRVNNFMRKYMHQKNIKNMQVFWKKSIFLNLLWNNFSSCQLMSWIYSYKSLKFSNSPKKFDLKAFGTNKSCSLNIFGWVCLLFLALSYQQELIWSIIIVVHRYFPIQATSYLELSSGHSFNISFIDFYFTIR